MIIPVAVPLVVLMVASVALFRVTAKFSSSSKILSLLTEMVMVWVRGSPGLNVSVPLLAA